MNITEFEDKVIIDGIELDKDALRTLRCFQDYDNARSEYCIDMIRNIQSFLFKGDIDYLDDVDRRELVEMLKMAYELTVELRNLQKKSKAQL